MKPSPFPFDDINRSVDILQRFAKEDEDHNISIRFAPVVDPFDLQTEGIDEKLLVPKRGSQAATTE